MRSGLIADNWASGAGRLIADLERPHCAEGGFQRTRQKKILVLSVSAGAGHTRAAEAISALCNRSGVEVSATHLDVMDYVPAVFRKLYTNFYITLIGKYPWLWRFIYQLTDQAAPDGLLQKLRRSIERFSTRQLLKEIALFEPDAIICTHFLPAEVLGRRIRGIRPACPVWVQVTDFDLHRMWVQEGMAGYFAANEEVAFRMRAHGIAPHAIHITGIPIMPCFGQPLGRTECACELGLDPKRLTFLLMGGGAGLGRLDAIAARLLAVNADFQLIALAGKNSGILTALQALAKRYPGRLIAQGHTNQIQRLMACADLAITKSGGLTISECLAMGLPMIALSPVPGQEERNADFLLEHGAALKAYDADTLEYRIRYLLRHPEKLVEMSARAKALGRPAAARNVVDTVLKTL